MGGKFLYQLVPDVAEAISTILPSLSVSNSSSQQTKEDVPFRTKTLREFRSYCQKKLLPDLKEFEKKRQRTLWTILITGIIVLVFPYLIILGFSHQFILNSDIFFILYLLIFSFGLSVWIIFCQSCTRAYSLGFKQKIIEKIVTFIDDNQQFNYASQLLLEDKRSTTVAFTQSQLFQDNEREPDFLEQEDCVYGKVNNTDFFSAEINVYNQSGSDRLPTIASLQKWHNSSQAIPTKILFNILKSLSIIIVLLIKMCLYLNNLNNHENTFLVNNYRRKLLFRGLFFTARFPKIFQGQIFVIPRSSISRIKALNFWRGELVKLEDSEFERLFTVYSNDQVQARYILSTNLMSKLVKFNQKAGRKVHISFLKDKIYIAIEYNYNLFEPKLWQSMLSFAPLREYFNNLQLTLGIVEELNLNRQIGHK